MGRRQVRERVGKKPGDVLKEFVQVFESKGWLNQDIRIRRCESRYRVFCSEGHFFVYRINDNCGLSHGFPGWPVCSVTHARITHDSEMSPLGSKEPTAGEWLRYMADGDFELI
jgi:hypothetical protein